ncbi:MAG: antibiotic biosynthesis monooxygenase [Desulfotomaculaceae bacterium]|nr:antibiotic biosynthesis monooxygenase [Desulfotomaculaceae bacterium]
MSNPVLGGQTPLFVVLYLGRLYKGDYMKEGTYMITVVGRLTAQPGKESALAEICSSLAKETHEKEKNCLFFIPHVSTENSAEIVIYAKYVNKEAYKVHARTPYFQEAKQKYAKLVEEKENEILDGELVVHFYKELI